MIKHIFYKKFPTYKSWEKHLERSFSYFARKKRTWKKLKPLFKEVWDNAKNEPADDTHLARRLTFFVWYEIIRPCFLGKDI